MFKSYLKLNLSRYFWSYHFDKSKHALKMGNTRSNFRIYHRYPAFFLAGIMAVYAVSGTILIFRNTDF